MKILRLIAAVLGWLTFAGVLVYAGGVCLVGEATWPTTVALYLPHGLLLGGLAAMSLVLLAVGPRRLILAQLVAALVVVFPVMGLHLGGPATPAGGPRLRVLTFNVDSGNRSVDEIVAQIRDAAPDVVLLQECDERVDRAVAAALPGFATKGTTQFFFASRWPIVDVELPPPILHEGVERSPRFVRYTIDTPLGALDVFNIHPISPREGFESIRAGGLRREIESGRVFHGDRHELEANTALRKAQAAAIADAARRAAHPVILAGDTNLPGGSRILADNLGGFQDAFAEVGRGFGYTFPAHKLRPWMRLDRILAGRELRFLDVEVGRRPASDHYCVWADLERRP